MTLYVDLHIHTCLSPCADNDMTPNNIVHMAKLKGLDAIAITDHNGGQNLEAAAAVAKRNGLLLVPGLELTTAEEIHLLCYFPKVQTAIQFGELAFHRLMQVPNRNQLFGHQLVVDDQDQVLREEEQLLISSTDLPLKQATELCRSWGGVPVPAHINKACNSLLTTLGAIPPECRFSSVEVHRKSSLPTIDLSDYRVLYSSDAHSLGEIAERTFALDVHTSTIEGILSVLKKG